MRYALTVSLLLVLRATSAQVTISQVALHVNAGVGISTKPARMFGAPLFLSADLGVAFTSQWRISAEAGVVTGFRDAEYPTQKIGLIVSSYSRYEHSYGGLRIGRNLLDTARTDQLVVSAGANYLAVTEPNVNSSSGLLGGLSYHPRLKRYLSIPLQVDYSIRPFYGNTQLTFSGRWNVNPYHSFPTISAGIGMPAYARRKTQWRKKTRGVLPD